METRSILVATLTIYCGLYYLTNHLEESSKIGLFVMMILCNLYFFVYWFFKISGAYLNIARKKVPCLKRIFSRELNDGMPDQLTISPIIHDRMYFKGKESIYTIVPHMKDEVTEVTIYDNMKEFFLNVVRE